MDTDEETGPWRLVIMKRSFAVLAPLSADGISPDI